MNILISTNSNYLMPTVVMLESLFENNKGKIKVYMLYSNLSKSEISTINELISSKFNGELILLKVDKSIFKDAPIISRFSEEIYYRLLAQDILPRAIERVLYLDVDIIINKSLEEFYNQSFDDKYLVVCEGIGMSKRDIKTYKNLDIPLEEKYFNSGVILYNLKKMREDFSTNMFFDYIKEKKEVLTMPDQDVLNGLLYDKVKYNDYKIYNYGIIHVKSRDDKKFLKENTAIIHYIGAMKPWNYRYILYADDLFWKYANNTEYKKIYKYYKFSNSIYRLWYKFIFLSKKILKNIAQLVGII